MNAIALLKSDHQAVENLFSQYQKLSDASAEQKQNLVAQMIELLSIHAFIEEQSFYPVVQAEIESEKHTVFESFEEHGIVKLLLSELNNTSADDERYDAKVKVLIDLVRHHVEEEEKELFPKVSAALSRKRLDEIGSQLQKNRQSAPTSPLPGIGYLNKALNAVGPATDRMRQRGRGMVQKVVSAANRRSSRAAATVSGRAAKSKAPRKSAAKSKTSASRTSPKSSRSKSRSG